MPEISRFYGIVIYLYYREHEPPHFHALYGGSEATIAIDSLALLSGRLRPRALGLVIEWATIHREELLREWERARNHEPLGKIDPLP